MSDWEDEEPQSARNTAPVSAQHRNQNGGGDWDDEPTSHQDRNHDRARYSGNHDQQSDQITFTINKSNVGLVIGRGGSKIKELERTYNVKLEIGMNNYFFYVKMVIHFYKLNEHILDLVVV